MAENTNRKQFENFDFDAWAKLAKSDPEKFEQKRREVIRGVIESTPPKMQKRLYGLQWRVDMEIGRSKNSLDACLRLHKMMMNSVYESGGLLEAINSLFDNDQNSKEITGNSNGVVVNFPVQMQR